MKVHRLLSVAVAAIALALGGPTVSSAATIGQTSTSGLESCGGGTTFLEDGVGGPPAYTVPAGGGVITSWSTYAGPDVTSQLKSKKLAKVRNLLTAAHCTLGKVKRPKHRKGKLVVKSQSPSPGTALADGASVAVKLGPKPHHEKHR